MGWGPGYEPKDGDGPHDLLHGPLAKIDFFKPFGKTAKLVPAKWLAWELVGLIQLVLGLGQPVPEARVRQAVEGMKGLLEDQEWLDSWRDPKKHARSVRRWLKLLSEALERRKGAKKRLRRRLIAHKQKRRRMSFMSQTLIYPLDVFPGVDGWRKEQRFQERQQAATRRRLKLFLKRRRSRKVVS